MAGVKSAEGQNWASRGTSVHQRNEKEMCREIRSVTLAREVHLLGNVMVLGHADLGSISERFSLATAARVKTTIMDYHLFNVYAGTMQTILKAHQELATHPVYDHLTDVEVIRRFMSVHVYAVWDFMSLLKALQLKLTCVEVPWNPSPYPAEVVRLINQIVLVEESDIDQNGTAISHFDLYLRSMEELGASTANIKDFLSVQDLDMIPQPAQNFVRSSLTVAKTGHVVEIAANFFFGREKLVPSMFQSIADVLTREKVEAPTFLYYLKRHIEVDGDEHGPLAQRCLEILTRNDKSLMDMALKAGEAALAERKRLWDGIVSVN